MIFIIFFGCTASPKDIKNETMTNKTNETIENKTGDSMAKTENEEIIEVMIREYESASIFENWTVKVNGIFMHSGKIKAELDVSGGFDELLKDTPSMPLYIGHERSDEVIVGHGRDYYLKEIKKLAKKLGAKTIGFIGKGGGALKALVDLALTIPSDDTQRIQESHITIGHIICDLVEEKLFG